MYVHFLIVGHTHDRVDQFFSCISRHLQKADAWTVQQLFEEVKRSYNVKPKGPVYDPLCVTAPEIVQLHRIGEWSEFFGKRAGRGVDGVDGEPAPVWIPAIKTPHVFHFFMNADGDVLLETKESSAEVVLVSDGSAPSGRSKFESSSNPFTPAVVVIPKRAPVPFLDPLVAAPAHRLDIHALRHVTFAQMKAGSDEFRHNEKLQNEWLAELDLHEREVAKGVCSTCVDFRQRMDDIVVLSEHRLKGKSPEEVQANKVREKQKRDLDTERKAHMAERGEHKESTFESLWTRPLTSRSQQEAGMYDRVLVSRSQHVLNTGGAHFAGQLTQAQIDRHEVAWRQQLIADIEERKRKLLTEVRSLAGAEHTPFVGAYGSSNVAAAQARGTMGPVRAQRNNHLPNASANPEPTERKAGDLAVADVLYQRRNLPIHVGYIVAVLHDNYQWPEYTVSLYQVNKKVVPSRRSRGKKPAAKKKGGKRKRRSRDEQDADMSDEPNSGEQQSDIQHGRTSTGPINVRWRPVSKGIPVCSADFHDKERRDKVIRNLMKNNRHTVHEVRQLEARYLMHGEEKEDETIYYAWPYYLQQQSYASARVMLDYKIQHYMKYGDKDELARIADDIERKEREAAGADGDEDDDVVMVEEKDDGRVVDDDGDDEYVPAGKSELSKVQAQRRQHRDQLAKRRRLTTYPEATSSCPASSASTSHPSSASSLPPSESGQAAAGVCHAPKPLSQRAIGILTALASKYEWTRDKSEPDLWDNVYSSVNQIFEPARPQPDVLKNIEPFFSLTDYRPRQLSMHVIKNKDLNAALRHGEALCWDEAHKVLDSKGFMVDEFILRCQASIEEFRSEHQGWHADDSITSSSEAEDEEERKDDETESEEEKKADADLNTTQPSAVNPPRPLSSPTASTDLPPQPTEPLPQSPPLPSRTQSPASSNRAAPRRRARSPMPQRQRKATHHYKPGDGGGSLKTNPAEGGGSKKRTRPLDPIPPQHAALYNIPGVPSSGTLGSVVPPALLAGGVEREGDAMHADGASAVPACSSPNALLPIPSLSVAINSPSSTSVTITMSAESNPLQPMNTVIEQAAISSSSHSSFTAASILADSLATHTSASPLSQLDVSLSQQSVDSQEQTQRQDLVDEEMMMYVRMVTMGYSEQRDAQEAAADSTGAVSEEAVPSETTEVLPSSSQYCPTRIGSDSSPSQVELSMDESVSDWSVAVSGQSGDESGSSQSY